MIRPNPWLGLTSLALLSALVPNLVACGSEGGGDNPSNTCTEGVDCDPSQRPDHERAEGQTDYSSSPPAGLEAVGAPRGGAAESSAGNAAPAPAGDAKTSAAPDRKVEETDLYRVEGNRLYYLNSYRGLLVFDITNVDAPQLLGRSPIFGSPVEMIVRNGVATVVVGDWYGTADDGSPFHGSVVRSIDASNPAAIKVTGETRIAGWVQDTRVVGDVLYAVSQDWGWYYGYLDGSAGTTTDAAYSGSKIFIASVSFAGGKPVLKGQKDFKSYSGAFYVTKNKILLAHDILQQEQGQNWGSPTGKSQLELIDISDPNGTIASQGTFTVNGSFQGWGTDNGRFNVDFADEHYARVLTCGDGTVNQYGYYDCGGPSSVFTLSTVDFGIPLVPQLSSAHKIQSAGWLPAARFDKNRLYLSPSNYYWSGNSTSTPVDIYDLSDPATPKKSGSLSITGQVWNFTPAGDRIFALGSEYTQNGQGMSGSQVSLRYIDVSDPTNPALLGTSNFGDGWAWTPAAGTFKAFGLNAEKGIVALPFSSWGGYPSYESTNGLQLIQFTPTTLTTSGVARTKGYVERGVFVKDPTGKDRLVSLSDLALSVVDYTNPATPKVTAELTLARNVVNARPNGATIAQLSSDWWDRDTRKSELRVLPIADAEENRSLDAAVQSVSIDGTNAQVFHNGGLSYVVTTKFDDKEGPYSGKSTRGVQVVDYQGGKAVLRGKVDLPTDTGYGYYGYGGYYGCYWNDWWDDSSIVQVGQNALAFRRAHYSYDYQTKSYSMEQRLYIVDITNPDAPALRSTLVTEHDDWWWGNVRAVGNDLYVTHYEWISNGTWNESTNTWKKLPVVKYYLDKVDLSDRSNPKITERINVPGLLVGNSETDPSLLYFADYRWWGNDQKDEISVAKIVGKKAVFQGSVTLEGYTGSVFVRGNTAYLSAVDYGDQYRTSKVKLHQIDLSNPKKPVATSTSGKNGWGWLLGVEGDRAVVTTGWGSGGIDIYRLGKGAPAFDQFVRTRGWYTSSLSRQANTLFLSSGYWGVQTVTLQ